MKKLARSLLVSLLFCSAASAEIVNNGDGTSSLYYIHNDAVVADFDAALQEWADAQGNIGFALFVLVVRDQAVITDEGGAQDRWSLTVGNALGNAFITTWSDKLGFQDENTDNLDDNTGLTRQQVVDASIKSLFRSAVNAKRQQDQPPPADVGDPN